MIKINNYKLTPAITATWGDITGDVRNQEDLVEYIKENGTATWGSISGNISDQKDLMNTLEGYATESWVNDQGYLTSTSLTGYATESWVNDQGYITSKDLMDTLEEYATESWVNDQGYLTEHQPLKTINDNSLVGEGNIEIGGLTPEQEEALTPLLDKSEGVLYTDVIESNKFNFKPWSGNFRLDKLFPMVDGSIYLLDSFKVYKWTPETMNFEFIVNLSQTNSGVFWMDNSGRLFQGKDYEIDLATGSVTYVDLNWNNYYYTKNRHNLFYGDRGIWCVEGNFSKLYDEQLKEFTDTYSTTLPQDYSGNIMRDICNVFTYKGHKLFHTKANKTYEVVETDDGLTVTDVTGVYFPIPTTFTIDDPYFMFSTENGNLYYIHNYDRYIYTGTGTWETSDIPSDYSFNSSYAVSGNYVLGGVNMSQNSYSILNVGPTQKITSWTPVNNVAVDLVSDQNITGQKKFDDADIQNLSIFLIQTMSGESRLILGKNTTEADNMEFTVPGKFTLNGVNIATTDNCFINKSIATSGPDYKGICAAPNPYYYGFFKTPSGRLMLNIGNPVYEFDGTHFNQVQTVTVYPKGRNFATITDGLFAIDTNNNLIKWNDETSNWEVIIPLVNSSDYIWAADANTLRAGYTHKLSNTDGTYSWVDDPTANNIGTCKTISYVIGENVYMVSGYDVYKYEESSKTFTRIAYTRTFILRCIVFENNLYYVGNDNIIHKLDFPQDPLDEIVDNYTDIIYTGQDSLYIEYNNKLYITNTSEDNDFGYCYGVEETTPEVPATDGTYVLKATVLNGQVTYSWEVDEVPQAVQITNQILE